MHIPALIHDLAIILLMAGATTILFKKLKQPLVLGYIIAGFIVGPYFRFFPSITDTESINTWSEIGIIILMFALGLEFNLHKLIAAGVTALITAGVEVVGMLLVGFGCGKLLGWSTMNSIYLGGMLSMSSTTIIIKAFEDLQLKGKKFTETVFGTLVVEDIAGIFMMVMLSTIAVSRDISGGKLVSGILEMLFYLALWLILGIFLLPSILKRMHTLMNDEMFLVVSLGMCFGMVLLANFLGFSSALGAFLAGSLLAGTIHGERIEHINKPVKDLFGAVFFVSVGMMVNPTVIAQYIVPILIITAIVIFVKSVLSSAGVLLSGQSLHTAISSGCSLAQIGEFSFIIASLGISLGVISDYIYPIIVSVSVITTFTTPFVIRSADGIYAVLNKALPEKFTRGLEHSDDGQAADKDNEWSAFITDYFSGLIIYGIILLAIDLSCVWLLMPFLWLYVPGIAAAVITAALILLLASPFMQQVLLKTRKFVTVLWFKKQTNHFLLIALMVFRSALMLFLLIFPIILIFDFPLLQNAYIVLAALAIEFLITRSNRLLSAYLKFEARFVINFNERKSHERKSGKGKDVFDAAVGQSRLDDKIYVGNIKCDEYSLFMDIPLNELMIKLQTPIKIIKILRDGSHINIPTADEKLLVNDSVFIAAAAESKETFQMIMRRISMLGEDMGSSTLREFLEKQQQNGDAESDQLFCCSVNMSKDSALVGTSIKNSNIKSGWGSFLLGIERDNYPIVFPDINMRIENNDLLWILGPEKMIDKLAEA